MAIIVSVIQEKGGTGKSTIATNLVGIAKKGLKVALIDCDMPQGTSQSWAAIRLSGNPGAITAKTASTYQELIRLVDEIQSNHDLIVIDSPPRLSESTKAALILSNLALVPLGASAAEIWATSDLITTIETARQSKQGLIDARILWNRFRSSTNSAKELSVAVQKQLNLKQLKTKLGYRVAYSEALARGMTVLEWTDKQARAEIGSLGDELNKILKTKIFERE